jgi:hypothetical protein
MDPYAVRARRELSRNTVLRADFPQKRDLGFEGAAKKLFMSSCSAAFSFDPGLFEYFHLPIPAISFQ